MCGFKRPALSASQPLSVAPDISAIDNRLDQLQGFVLSSANAKQKNSLNKEFSAFLGSLPGIRPCFPLPLKMFVDFLLGKIPEGKRKSMLPLVHT